METATLYVIDRQALALLEARRVLSTRGSDVLSSERGLAIGVGGGQKSSQLCSEPFGRGCHCPQKYGERPEGVLPHRNAAILDTAANGHCDPDRNHRQWDHDLEIVG